MESDLSLYHHGLDYRDRWRFDEDGNRRLTLRMIWVRLRHLPPDSACARAEGGPGWRVSDYLLADVFHALAGKPHPELPKPATAVTSADRVSVMRKARARALARRRAIAAGHIT